MSYKSVKEVVTMLQENGFRFVRQTGSHVVFTNGKRVAVVPDHGKKALRKALITTF